RLPPAACRSRRGAPAPRSPLPRWPMPPRRGSRPFGASPARARPLAAPHPDAPADPRPARPARRRAARAARLAARAPNHGPAHSAALLALRRRCLWPPVASRAPPGTGTPRALPLHWYRGTSDEGGSPGRLVRVGLLLHRLMGLGRSEEHTFELQSLAYLVCRLLL